MTAALNFLYLASLAFWIGGIFFFSAIAGPSIFKTLDRAVAGNLVSAIFPKYYLLGYVCGFVAMVSTVTIWMTATAPGAMTYVGRIAILAAMLGVSGYSGLVLRQEAVSVRTELRQLSTDDAEYSEVSRKFASVHRKSVMLNGLVFVLGLVILFISAWGIRA